jgi:hypothetical protein
MKLNIQVLVARHKRLTLFDVRSFYINFYFISRAGPKKADFENSAMQKHFLKRASFSDSAARKQNVFKTRQLSDSAKLQCCGSMAWPR